MLLLFFSGIKRRPSVGSSISGGTFSRKRWHDIVEAQEVRLRRAEEKARREKEREFAQRTAVRQANMRVRQEAREAAKAQDEAQIHALALANHNAAARGLEQLRQVAALAAAQARAGAAAHPLAPVRANAPDDDEEAMALLLLAQGRQ
jgi:hypothetical protein